MSRRGESIYKRKDGRWEARYIHHYEQGCAKYRYLYGHTYAEVKSKRIKELAAPRTMATSVLKGSALFEELAGLWLAEVKPSVKESTFARYHRIVHRYLMPSFFKTSVLTLDARCIKSFSASLLQGNGERAPLSPKTVSDILCVLKSICKHGRQNGYPCADLLPVKLPSATGKPTQILSEFARETVEKSIIESKVTDADSRVKLGVLFALYTGLRIGELCGLRESDIDWSGRCVTVSATVERIADLEPNATTKTKVIVSNPKTEAAARMIPLPPFLMDYLQAFLSGADCYLLTGSEKHTEPHQFYMRYKTFMKSLGLEQYTFHALRHTFATRCVEYGFDAKTLSEILGHTSVSTTLALYVHPTPEQKRRQMEKLCPALYS